MSTISTEVPVTSQTLLQEWVAYAEGLLDIQQLKKLVKQSKQAIKRNNG